MKKGILLFPSIAAMCLTACAGVKHEVKDYILDLNINHAGDVRILQLTDTHIGDKDNTKLHYDFMDLTINDAKKDGLDLIVVTGDVFTFASKGTAKEFFKWLDGHDVPWTLTFGNHDEQCFFSIDWLTGELNKMNKKRVESNGKDSHCVFYDIQDDDIQGNSNFAINLKREGDIIEQLIIMDSNRYNYNGYFGYDFFKQDQIDWYSSLINYTRDTLNGGTIVPSLMFYHIPLPEVNNAWADASKGDVAGVEFIQPRGDNIPKGQQNEDPCNPDPDHDLGFYKVIEAAGSTHGMYFGHDHINNYIVDYHGIHFGYGVKATDRVYANDNLMGGRVINLHPDHTVDYEDYYHTYAEVGK